MAIIPYDQGEHGAGKVETGNRRIPIQLPEIVSSADDDGVQPGGKSVLACSCLRSQFLRNQFKHPEELDFQFLPPGVARSGW